MRSFQLDSGISTFVDGLNTAALQVGLLLGRVGVGQRNLVYKLLLLQSKPDELPFCSLNENEVAPSKKGAKASKSALDIDTGAVVDRALQVSALLTGGVEVMGVALVASEDLAAAALPQLARIADEVTADRGQAEATWLLLCIDPASHKLTAKEHSARSKQAGQPKPCDIKFLDVAAQLKLLTCRHSLDVAVNLPADGRNIGESLSRQMAAESERVSRALCTVAGKLVGSGTSVAELAGGSNSLELELLCAAPCDCKGTGEAEPPEACGRLLVRGSVAGAALAHLREPAAAAAELLRADVARSLQARVDVLLAEAEEGGQGAALIQVPREASVSVSLPRRALFPIEEWLQASDYVLAGEGRRQVVSAAKEALNLDLEPSSVRWPENGSPKKANWTGNESGSIDSGLGEGRPPIPFGFRTGQQVLWVSTVICVVSCLVSYLLLAGYWPRH